jgi:4-amino-4-deoxy-L-arabinose transferase-like glycosyltransferase
VARAVLDGGSVWLPLREGRDVPSKPPLFHWLAATALRVGIRPEELAVRLPSCLASAAALALTAGVGARWYGSAAGVLAAAMLGSSFEWLRVSIQARVDMTLTLLVTAAAFAFHAGMAARASAAPPRAGIWWIRTGYLLAGAAVLTKGPVGLVLPLLIAVAGAAVTGDTRRARALVDPMGVALATVPALGWYLLAWKAGGSDFLQRQILHENLQRFLGGDHDARAEPFYYYGITILGGFFPWTLLMPLATAAAWRRRGPHDRLLTAWIVTVFTFFSLAAGKRSAYLLPLFPPLALLAARAVVDVFASPPAAVRRWLTWALASVAVLAALGIAGGGEDAAGRWIAAYLKGRDLAHVQVVTAIVHDRRWQVAIVFGIVAAGLALSAGTIARGPRLQTAALCFVALAWAGGLTAFGTYPIARALTLRPFAEQVRMILQEDDVLWARGWVDYGFRYYVGHPLRPWPERRGATGGREFLVGAPPKNDADYRRRGLVLRISDLRAATLFRHELAEVREAERPAGPAVSDAAPP